MKKALKKQEPEPMQEPKKSDPYDSRTICPDTPKCCVVGDPFDNPVQYIYEENDNV